jgi:leader peptidase (prepilin peptidase)/N-methyltransferase
METLAFLKQTHPGFIIACVLLFGAAVGSFLNVCIYRIPASKSIILPSSSCGCGQRIPFYLNVPILGWLLLRGKAKCCQSPISFRYPAVEIATALLFVVCWLQFDIGRAFVAMGFTSILLAASFIDFDTLEIPDRFSVGGALLGVVISTMYPQLHGIPATDIMGQARADGMMAGLTGMLVGAGAFYWVCSLGYIVFRKDVMGEGDVKLAGCIGAFCGWQGAMFALVGGALVGLALAPVMCLASKSKQWSVAGVTGRGTEEDEGFAMPFGPAIAIAGWLYFMGWDFGLLDYFSL